MGLQLAGGGTGAGGGGNVPGVVFTGQVQLAVAVFTGFKLPSASLLQ